MNLQLNNNPINIDDTLIYSDLSYDSSNDSSNNYSSTYVYTNNNTINSFDSSDFNNLNNNTI